MKEQLITGVTCLLIGGGLGFLAKGNSPAPSEKVEIEKNRAIQRGATATTSQASREKLNSYAEITNQPGQTSRISGLIEFYSNLAGDQFAEEAEKLDALPFSERVLAAYLLFSSWAETSPTDAMEHARTKMGFAGNFVKPTVLQSWAASDPVGASLYFQENKSEFQMMSMMGRRGMRGRRGGGGGGDNSAEALIAGEWAKQDPAAALKWASELNGRGEGSRATASALKVLAKDDPRKAAEMLTNVDEENRRSAYQSIASEWAKSDWNETEGWIKTLPAEDQEEAFRAGIVSLAAQDSQLAADKVLGIEDDDIRNDAMGNVVGELAKQDPSGAMAWLMENGSEEGKQDGVGNVIRPWVAQDPQGALAWVSEQPVGPVRDSAVSSYIFNEQSGPATPKIELAETITDERTRDRALGIAVFQLIGEDQEAGAAYVEESDLLSERAKDRVLRRLGR